MLKIHATTDVGLVRGNNEDYHSVDPENHLIILADGAGGHDHGEIASRLAVESCYQYLTREDYISDTSNVPQTLMESITFANQQLIEYKKKHMAGSNMGTTLSVVHIDNGEASYAWMGDSRIYLLDPAEVSMSQLSVDHTLYQEMQDRGEVGEAYKKSILSRMLGNNPFTRPDGDKVAVRSAQLLFVCSDGFSDLVHDNKTLKSLADCKGDYDALVATFIDLAKDQGGRDNITVAIGVAP